MSTAEILSLISLISYIIAGIAAVLAVFFWFFFKIPAVIGDLSGRTAKKSIARKRASNERSGGKGYQPSATNANRGKLTDTMQHSRKLKDEPKKAKPVDESQMPETGLLKSNTAQTARSTETELLGDTANLETTADETAELVSNGAVGQARTGGVKLTMLDEVVLTHTDEVIS